MGEPFGLTPRTTIPTLRVSPRTTIPTRYAGGPEAGACGGAGGRCLRGGRRPVPAGGEPVRARRDCAPSVGALPPPGPMLAGGPESPLGLEGTVHRRSGPLRALPPPAGVGPGGFKDMIISLNTNCLTPAGVRKSRKALKDCCTVARSSYGALPPPAGVGTLKDCCTVARCPYGPSLPPQASGL